MNSVLLKLTRQLVIIGYLMMGLQAHAIELLSEGAMGSVSAVSANTAEEIVNVAGSSAAGLRVDDGYEVLPFKTDVAIDEYATDEVSSELNYSLVQEVDSWADSLRQRSDVNSVDTLEVGYVDELPDSSFEESSFIIRDEEFDRLIFEPKNTGVQDQESTTYEIGRVEQAITKIAQNADSVQYIVERKVDFVATIDASISDDTPSIGSGYITDLTSISNVKIATFRD